MSRLRWPDSTNSVSEKPGTIHACIISIPRTVRHAVVNRLNPSIGRVRRLMNRWSCSMTLFRYLHWRRDERGRKNPSCLMASTAIG